MSEDAALDALLETLKRAAATLEAERVPYLLGGGLGCWVRGGPPSGKDIDLMVKREDEQAFTSQIDEFIEELCEPAEAGIAVSTAALAANPAALRQRIIRHVVASEFGVSLTRTQTLEVARLVTDWQGQGPIDLPGGIRATRAGSRIVFSTTGSTEVLPHDH